MREIKRCVAVVANPLDSDDRGEVTESSYFVEGEWLTLCTDDGAPLRDDNGGRFTVRLEPGDNEQRMAKRLALQRYRSEHRDELAGFNRRINYGRSGLA
jgi:hypothetical protein